MIYFEDCKEFRGIMRIHYPFLKLKPEEIEGNWLYRPQYNDWYNGECAYPANKCEIVKIYTESE
jgi:hypothetical protein